MKRLIEVSVIALLVAFAFFAYTCNAQTIPPGVGPRQYGAKLADKNNAQGRLDPSARKLLQSNSPSEARKTMLATLAASPASLPAVAKRCDDALHLASTRRQHGGPKTIAYRAVCGMDTHKYTSAQILGGLDYIDNLKEGDSYADAIAESPDPGDNPAGALAKAAINAQPQIDDANCDAVYNSDTKQFDYHYGHFLPASLTPCGQAAVSAFFNVTKSATFGNTVQYLYNPKVGASQFSSDLITAVFPQGFQVVLAGTGTVPTGQSTSQGSSSPPPAQTTSDPVALAVQKIESGGDFNLRFSLPLLSTPPGATAWSTYLQPSVGFVLGNTSSQANSAGAQVTYSSSNQYVISLPFESYFETSSITGDNSNGLTTATLFADLRYGGNILSPEYQKTIGIPDRIFQLGQASAGINFAGSFRIGFQYFFGGPKQAYVLANATGQTSNVNTSIKGFHIVFTYSPKKTN